MKLWDADLLHLCFDNITEYDPDVVFDKHAFWLKMLLFYETYLHSSVAKKECLKLE